MDNLSGLPAEIISDILTCLPAESVLETKLVSKTWRNLIQHPSFFKMHSNRLVSRSPEAYYTDCGELSFLALDTNKQHLFYFEYIDENHEKPVDRIVKVNLILPFRCYTLVGSFNGLICLRGYTERRFCICNPMTKEYVILPEPEINLGTHRCFGFGYLILTNEYRVVVVNKLKKEPNFVEVMVYTLGSGNGWRNIGKFKFKNNYVFEGQGTFANGALHWMHRKSRMVLVFDLADEKFRDYLSSPRKDILLPTGSPFDLGVLGEFLFCAHRYFYSLNPTEYLRSQIWLHGYKNDTYDMKRQDELQSFGWSMAFSARCTVPLAITKSGGFLSYSSSHLSVFDPKDFMPKRQVDFKKHFDQVIPHKNSFVSLKELGEEGTQILESLKIRKRKHRD